MSDPGAFENSNGGSEEIFLEARKTRAWLAGTPDRDAVLDFLRRDDPYEA